MQQSLNIMKVSLRVLAAVNEKQPPDVEDIQTLREYLGRQGHSNPDELACEVIQKALLERAKAREVQAAAGAP